MTQPLSIAFVWHMHQPYYRDRVTGVCAMPWVRLHATKDYLDMVARLASFPAIHQTFNFVPTLLDQLEEYLPPSNQSDVFLEASEKPAAELSEEEQRFLLRWFFLANLERMIRPYPRYHDLLAKRGLHVSEEDWPAVQKRFRTQDYLDLQVWFNLTWIDPWLRSQSPELIRLEAKGSQFSEDEKRLVLTHQRTLIAHTIGAYREAAARGQIELTTSPYYHPILPLLCDLRAAHMALPELPLPEAGFRHTEDARWHLTSALTRHQALFGARPSGLWPPEGSVSEEVVRLAMDAGLRWIATDEEILWRTLRAPRSPSLLYRPHLLRREGKELAILFRDRELSDLIGFVYSQWEPSAAIADFLKRLGHIHQRAASGPPALVSIILDGENAWESYPRDGHEFLTQLYTALAHDPRFRCVTVSEFLRQHPLGRTEPLPELFSGSWIGANFATWIGHPEKNTAWTHLAAARDALEGRGGEAPQMKEAWESFRAAEGSDWMWWFGDTHFSVQAEEFDRLFRVHLANSYRLAGLEVPNALQSPIRRPAVLHRYEPTGLVQATIDGIETSYYEWLYSGRVDLRAQYAAIQRSEQCLRFLYHGFDEAHHYLRLDLDRQQLESVPSWALELTLGEQVRIRIGRDQTALSARTVAPTTMDLPCAFDRILELAVPSSLLGLKEGEKLRLTLTLLQGDKPLERYPAQGTFELSASRADLEAQAWSV